ncbi:Holliday junction branch migration protein RuvA [Candidatus Neptunochlamydia vexilliferae]|uniref:Holliday junction branch migration complex subunit RuvA n=1 Tax=Candidatus Neptunichlamydia vexilliferae TaxID=1651774 RepID=A0ABS0AXA1_9BACT|nr:Holliday junction branch migration protein RuvA [Candidatus Neptunochlamydia vexilliferae]MBF5058753.1 Holliday junction ATP-dependent DNA helicase RuvA [Candidatus Neptunochlamydia vexilliferae]
MFEYLKGTLASLTPNKAVVDVGGVGYLLHTPLSVFSAMPPVGEEVLFYISSVIREDSHRNFAFLSQEERDLFEKISAISGIGPKTALALIGHLDYSALESAITTANASLLAKIPGIGKKTAERLIIELRDKVLKGLKKSPLPATPQKGISDEDQTVNDALSALMNLGYSSLHAQQAVKKALTHFDGPPDLSLLIKTSLSGM